MKNEQGSRARSGKERDLDNLTGVWNSAAMEARVTKQLPEGGALFLCDICHLKQINDRQGHLAGDECLQRTAQILGFLIRERDLLGRTDGDEFAVFLPGCRDENAAGSICRRIRDRFGAQRKKEERGVAFSVAVGAAVSRKGEVFQSLLARAREDMARGQVETRMPKVQNRDNYQKDVRQVRSELIEQIRVPGAYCQDYSTFKSIYRFLERGIIRGGQKSCVILLSVTDEEGRSIAPDKKDRMMERLGEDIHQTLRLGDVYTRYTSSQYLMLVMDTTENFADIIVERVRRSFLENGGSGLLAHYCYQLQPARVAKEW